MGLQDSWLDGLDSCLGKSFGNELRTAWGWGLMIIDETKSTTVADSTLHSKLPYVEDT